MRLNFFFRQPDKQIPLSSVIEDESNLIRERIQKCTGLRETYELFNVIQDMKAVPFKSIQAGASADSLMLELRNKQIELINNI